MKRLVMFVFAVCLVFGLAVGEAKANLIVNGGFEDPVLAANSWSIYSAITGWTCTAGGGIEVQRNAAGAPYEGFQHVELDSWDNSTMTQSIATTNGTSYNLSFAYSPRLNVGADSNGIEVFWNNVSLGVITAAGGSSTAWQVYNYTVTGTGNDTLQFQAVGTSDSLGGYIDSVSLNAVPLPPAVWLLGSGLLGLVGLRRRFMK